MQLSHGSIILRGIALFCAVTVSGNLLHITSSYNSSLDSFPEDGGNFGGPCSDNEYSLSNRCCQKCPAGTHVLVHCSTNHGLGYCKSCTAGKGFTAFPNGLNVCLPCRACREGEVLIEKCGVTRDALCQCKSGTYLCKANMNCSSIGTCSTCLSCPEGQRIKQQCNATANTVCEAHRVVVEAFLDSHKTALIIAVPAGSTIVICLIIFWIWRKRRRGENASPNDYPVKNEPDEDWLNDNLTKQFPDSQDSINSQTPLTFKKKESRNGSIIFTNEGVETSEDFVEVSKDSMEWLPNFDPEEATAAASIPAASIPADQLHSARPGCAVIDNNPSDNGKMFLSL